MYFFVSLFVGKNKLKAAEDFDLKRQQRLFWSLKLNGLAQEHKYPHGHVCFVFPFLCFRFGFRLFSFGFRLFF
jgi:hypothetical protein